MYEPPITNCSHGVGFLSIYTVDTFSSLADWILPSSLATFDVLAKHQWTMRHRLLLGSTYHLIYLSTLMVQQGVGEFSSWPLGGHWQGTSEPPEGMPDTRHDRGISWGEDLRREKGQHNVTSEPEWHIVMSATPFCLTDKSESSAGSLYARVWKWGSWSHSGTF